MLWLIVALGYLLGSIPTAYIARRLTKGRDIRHLDDDNMSTPDTFRESGAKPPTPSAQDTFSPTSTS